MKQWTIFMSGFLQENDEPDKIGGNGILRLYEAMEQKYVGPDHRMLMHEWDYSQKELASWIADTKERTHWTPRVNLVGYSWGGQSVINIAKHLKKHGLKVRYLITADAVVRRPLGARYLNSHKANIDIPDNVERLIWFRQQSKWPYGSNLLKADNTEEHAWFMNNHTHFNIDEAPQFYRSVDVALGEDRIWQP